MIRLNFFSSILIVLLITMSVKFMSLVSKIQDEARYTFVTKVSSSLIDTAYANESGPAVTPPAEGGGEVNAIKKEGAESGEGHKSKEVKGTPPSDPNITTTPPKLKTNLLNISGDYSKEEVKILRELSTRRQALDKTEESLNMKANVLKATENKLDQKVNELKALQNQVSELMKGYDEKEEIKYKSLVKIYENMKPKDAAKIFDELDMSMLVAIVTRMKEARSAPIIATMHPAKAKDLSVELTKYQTLGN